MENIEANMIGNNNTKQTRFDWCEQSRIIRIWYKKYLLFETQREVFNYDAFQLNERQ